MPGHKVIATSGVSKLREDVRYLAPVLPQRDPSTWLQRGSLEQQPAQHPLFNSSHYWMQENILSLSAVST